MAKDILYPLRRLHGWLHEYPQYRRERNALKAPYIQKIKAFQKSNILFAFLILTPEYGNWGNGCFAFDKIQGMNENNRMSWNHSWWGYMMFPELGVSKE